MQQPVLVIKLGTMVITNPDGTVSLPVIRKVAAQIATLTERYRIVLVSSGAVGSGRTFFKKFRNTLTERKAAAAVGNPVLIQLYRKYFHRYGIPVAQALCERQHFSHRSSFLQLKETFAEFWANNILPVVNENDLVSNVELKFSDNDELATLIAVGFDAERLVICTSAGGLLDTQKKVLPVVKKIDQSILSLVSSDKSSWGLGGMTSKLTFTRLAASLGITVHICGLQGSQPLTNAIEGKSGTVFLPQRSNLKARLKWLASGSITLGSIFVDQGASRALQQRRSLLTVGVRAVQGSFTAGEVVQLVNEDNQIIGVAKVKLDHIGIRENIARKNIVAAHADDIVIF